MQEEAFGEARLVETLETHKHLQPEQLIDKVFFGVSNFTQNVPQSDDQTLLVINISWPFSYCILNFELFWEVDHKQEIAKHWTKSRERSTQIKKLLSQL